MMMPCCLSDPEVIGSDMAVKLAEKAAKKVWKRLM
jgi:hypothetical protein